LRFFLRFVLLTLGDAGSTAIPDFHAPAEIETIGNFGHYPVRETPVYLAPGLEVFISKIKKS
jgi:hypothetical protein